MKRLPEPHLVIQFILDRCDYTRKVVAERIGIDRRTLRLWEYQLTNVRDCMVEKVAVAADYSLDRVPENTKERAAIADERRRKREVLRKEQAKNPPRDIKAPEPVKRPPIDNTKKPFEWCMEKNYGKPTARNSNPKTFGANMNASKGIAIPSDADYPDMRHLMTAKLPPYELVQVPQHYVPYLGADSGVISIGSAWVFKDAQGKRWFYVNKADALRTAEERRKIDTTAAHTVDDLI